MLTNVGLLTRALHTTLGSRNFRLTHIVNEQPPARSDVFCDVSSQIGEFSRCDVRKAVYHSQTLILANTDLPIQES